MSKKITEDVLLEAAQELLPGVSLSPGMTLREALRGVVVEIRKQADCQTVKLIAACAILAGLDSLALILLGRDATTGEELER
jgi:hypothetical protein